MPTPRELHEARVRALMANPKPELTPYFNWLLVNIAHVERIKPPYSPDLTRIVDGFLAGFTPKPKFCWQNAWEMARHNADVLYVEGWVDAGKPVAHAWNSFRGEHFDITPINGRVRSTYLKLFEAPYVELQKIEAQMNGGIQSCSGYYFRDVISVATQG